ncbi:hypothetical protein FSARC_10456 [Fusarium sarcochroum]|uniref:BTB domain-containing protein n=1 Tax=Fusarium sarcochroum TaxID=1208366 RepID=A0A8H4TMA7_9HYPO|nr:hypothetical protein FSARC_10456 [Fusarium sarcochroum]
MAPYASGSEPPSVQGSCNKPASSRKPSTYVFDSNGDTYLTLVTYKAQTFNWVTETIWVGQETPTAKHSKKKKRKKKETKEEGSVLPPSSPPPSPPAIQESPVTVPASLRETDAAVLSFARDEDPEYVDEKRIGSGRTDTETNADIPDLQVRDWGYGERPGVLHDHVEIRMLVSGKHLELASSYFGKLFAGPFMEAKPDQSGFRRVTANDWDPEAFNIVLTIMHGYHQAVPRSLSVEMLAKLAMIVDYYGCHESIELYTDIWLGNLKSKVPTVYGQDCILYMFISWVFTQPDMFQRMTQLALRHSGMLIEAEVLAIPGDLLEQIDDARQDSLASIFSAIYDLLDLLQKEPECSYECSSMLLGVLTKELRKHGCLSPRSARPFFGFSIEGSKDLINGLRKPYWYDERYSSRHSCTIQQKLSVTLEKMENELRVFNLQDFQFSKNDASPEEPRAV